MSVVDREINKYYDSQHYSLRLERDFMMSSEDFVNLFSGVYVASKRDKRDYYSNYYLIDIPKDQGNAIYL